MKKYNIVRIKFSSGEVMLFGNSYKPWNTQVDEYLWILKQNNSLNYFEEVTVSDSLWVSWGGLKWCPEEKFQHQLNREGCQSKDPDNPKPRKYDEMSFYKDSAVTSKVKSMIENYMVNIY